MPKAKQLVIDKLAKAIQATLREQPNKTRTREEIKAGIEDKFSPWDNWEFNAAIWQLVRHGAARFDNNFDKIRFLDQHAT